MLITKMKIFKLILIIYTELEVEIAKSIYASDYFSDLTIDEIEELASQEVDNEELNRLLVRKNEISTIYYSSNNPDELLKEFVEINKRIAELNGYERDEYILYSDECEYSREYSLLDVETLSDYILDYFFDLEYEVYSTVIGSDDQDENDIINAYVGNTILENKDTYLDTEAIPICVYEY